MLGMLVSAVLACQAQDAAEDARIRALVNQLMIADRPANNQPVFSLPPIRIPGEPEPKVDPKDPRIFADDAVAKLRALGIKGWPFLIERLDDQRQSIAMASEVPCTVARTCFHLIADEVNPRAPRGHFDDYDLLDDGDNIRSWWAERKGRNLPELQIEAARFAWALAEFDGKYVDHYTAVLRKLGVEDPSAGAAPWRALAATLKTPDDPEALVPMLAAAKEGDFLTRRAAELRGSRAWGKLRRGEVSAFPALARGLADPRVAEPCFRIMKGVLHPYGIEPHEDVEIITTPAEAAAWWRTRQGRSLKELQIEAARHARSGILKKTFASPESKSSLLEFIDEQIQRIESKP